MTFSLSLFGEKNSCIYHVNDEIGSRGPTAGGPDEDKGLRGEMAAAGHGTHVIGVWQRCRKNAVRVFENDRVRIEERDSVIAEERREMDLQVKGAAISNWNKMMVQRLPFTTLDAWLTNESSILHAFTSGEETLN